MPRIVLSIRLYHTENDERKRRRAEFQSAGVRHQLRLQAATARTSQPIANGSKRQGRLVPVA